MSGSRSILESVYLLTDYLVLTAFCGLANSLCSILSLLFHQPFHPVLLSHLFCSPRIGSISPLSLLSLTRIQWLLSFQSGGFSKLRTCQHNPDNNINMCDTISEIVSMFPVLYFLCD